MPISQEGLLSRGRHKPVNTYTHICTQSKKSCSSVKSMIHTFRRGSRGSLKHTWIHKHASETPLSAQVGSHQNQARLYIFNKTEFKCMLSKLIRFCESFNRSSKHKVTTQPRRQNPTLKTEVCRRIFYW